MVHETKFSLKILNRRSLNWILFHSPLHDSCLVNFELIQNICHVIFWQSCMKVCKFIAQLHVMGSWTTTFLFLLFTARKRSRRKVMFSEASVSHFVHGGSASRVFCLQSGGYLGGYWFLVVATEAGDTHPTWMHSCFCNINSYIILAKYMCYF